MKRAEFNETLRRKLDGIAEADRKNILDYYNECIDDRMDEGASEEEAIAALGSVDELAAAVLADTPVTGLIPRVIPKRERSDSAPQADAQVIGQDFRSVDAELRSCDLRLAPSTDGRCRVVYDGSARFGTPEVRVYGNRLVLRFEPRALRWTDRISGWLQDSGVRLVTVYLPARDYADLRVELDSGDCRLEAGLRFELADLRSKAGDIFCASAIREMVRIGTASGDAEVEGVACDGEMVWQSASGDFHASTVRCGKLRAGSTSGEIAVRGLDCGQAEIRTISGEVTLEDTAVARELRLHTVSGDQRIGCRSVGTVNAVTVSGDIAMHLPRRMQFSTSTVSGSVTAPASDPAGAPCRVKSVSGDIAVYAE